MNRWILDAGEIGRGGDRRRRHAARRVYPRDNRALQDLIAPGARRPARRDLPKVSLRLGHADTQTTMTYLCADPTEKLATVTAVVPMPPCLAGRF